MSTGEPNLDVRLTRSTSGRILDIDFVGGLTADTVAVPAPGSVPLVPPKSPKSKPSAPSGCDSALILHARKLKILEHRVHKVEMRARENDEAEEELIVSNLRPFLLKVGVHDHMDQPILDCSIPLRAALLYENGLPVMQTSSSEPLLVGETDVVALQGSATFKLRITSLSSHRDKQRFRIHVSPTSSDLLSSEPSLCVVTDPMKSVTKLGRASAPPLPLLPNPSADNNLAADALKRRYRDSLDAHTQFIDHLMGSQQSILAELRSLYSLVKAAKAAKTAGGS